MEEWKSLGGGGAFEAEDQDRKEEGVGELEEETPALFDLINNIDPLFGVLYTIKIWRGKGAWWIAAHDEVRELSYN